MTTLELGMQHVLPAATVLDVLNEPKRDPI